MIGLCTHLLFGAKNIERIGDHATNIAENIYYLVHGKALRDERPKKDNTSTTPFETLRSADPMSASILIVEDEEPMQILLTYNLEAEGYRVFAATAGEDVPMMIAEERPEPHHARLDAARHIRHRGLPAAARQARDPRHPHHHADRPRRGGRARARPRHRRRRLYRQALLGARADRPHPHHPAPRQSRCGGRGARRGRPGARPPDQARYPRHARHQPVADRVPPARASHAVARPRLHAARSFSTPCGGARSTSTSAPSTSMSAACASR